VPIEKWERAPTTQLRKALEINPKHVKTKRNPSPAEYQSTSEQTGRTLGAGGGGRWRLAAFVGMCIAVLGIGVIGFWKGRRGGDCTRQLQSVEILSSTFPSWLKSARTHTWRALLHFNEKMIS
jgi:hypothetical protein